TDFGSGDREVRRAGSSRHGGPAALYHRRSLGGVGDCRGARSGRRTGAGGRDRERRADFATRSHVDGTRDVRVPHGRSANARGARAHRGRKHESDAQTRNVRDGATLVDRARGAHRAVVGRRAHWREGYRLRRDGRRPSRAARYHGGAHLGRSHRGARRCRAGTTRGYLRAVHRELRVQSRRGDARHDGADGRRRCDDAGDEAMTPHDEVRRGFLERVIAWSVSHSAIVLGAATIVSLAGVWAMLSTPVDAIPDLSDVQVIVMTDWPGQSPQLVEDQVTYPLETEMLKVPHIKFVRGMSQFGLSAVYVVFEDGTDLYWARSRVLEYLSSAQAKLPQGATPSMGPDATGVGWVMQYILADTSGNLNLAQLRGLQDF